MPTLLKRLALILTLLPLFTLVISAQDDTTTPLCNPALQNEEVFYDQGFAAYTTGRYEDALLEFTCALSLNSNYLDALHMRGLTLEQLERPEEAIRAYSTAIAMDPEYIISYVGLGNASLEVEDFSAAITYFTEYLERRPDDASIVYNRALAYYRDEKYAESLLDYDRALELDPGYSLALAGRARTLNALGRPEEALTSVESAFELEINSYSWFFGVLGDTYQELGEYEKALDAYKTLALLVEQPPETLLENIDELEALLGVDDITATPESTEEIEETATATPESVIQATSTPGPTNAPVTSPTAQSTPEPTVEPTTPVVTPSPTIQPTPTATTPAGECTVRAIDSANRRNGPGTEFTVIGTLTDEDASPIDAQRADSDGYVWWRLRGGFGWVREDTVFEEGDCQSVQSLN